MKAPEKIYLPPTNFVTAQRFCRKLCATRIKENDAYIAYARVRELTGEECDALYDATGGWADILTDDRRAMRHEAVRQWFAKIQGGDV